MPIDLTAIDRDYRQIGDADYRVIEAALTAATSPMLATAQATHQAASPHSALFWAQAFVENRWETTGILIHPEDHNPVSMRPWAEIVTNADGTKTITYVDPRTKNGLPPGCTGVIKASTDETNQYLKFGADAAAAAEWKYRVTDPSYKGGVYTDKHTVKEMTDTYCPPGDVHPVTGVANEDIHYADVVIAKLKEFAAAETALAPAPSSPPASGGTSVYSTAIPGLPGGPLETSFPVKLKILDKSMTLNRPGIKAQSPRRGVQHGNGNPNSSAAGEASYLNQGAPDNQGRPQQTSYHSAIDDKECWVMIPADEVTWQAADGAGPGNMNGFSCEQVEDRTLWSDPARAKQCIANAAEWMGKIAARLGIDKPEQHWNFNWVECCDGPCDVQCGNRHNCPDKLRHTAGAWDSYVTQWNAAKQAELTKMTGKPQPQPVPTPGQFDWSKAAKPVPIPALAATDVSKNDTAPGITSSDGTDFVFVSDVVEVTQPVKRLQYADQKAASTGPDLQPGERFVGAWLFKAKDGAYYYLTPAPYWTRILARDASGKEYVKRVADAPLKGTP